MKILGGLINLVNPIDRVLGHNAWKLTGLTKAADATDSLGYINDTTDELYIVKLIVISLKCITAPTTEPFFNVRGATYNGAPVSILFEIDFSNLTVGETIVQTIPLELVFGNNQGMWFDYDGDGSGGAYDISIYASYERVSR